MNGISSLTSARLPPRRATISAAPMLNAVCSARGGDQQEPVHGQRFPADQHDRDQHHKPDQHLLQFHDHVGQRQRGAREVQGADQLKVGAHHVRARHDRPLGEREHEHAGEQERRVVLDAARGLEEHAEDQVVHARVQQRGEHLPELAELRLGVHRDVPRGGVADDEVPALPQHRQVLPQRRAGPGELQAVLRREFPQRLVRDPRRLGHDDRAGLKPSRSAELPASSAVLHGREVYWTSARNRASS